MSSWPRLSSCHYCLSSPLHQLPTPLRTKRIFTSRPLPRSSDFSLLSINAHDTKGKGKQFMAQIGGAARHAKRSSERGMRSMSSSSSSSLGGSREGRSPGRSERVDYFSRSFLAPVPLPLPSTSPLLPLTTPIPDSLPSTLLPNGLPNPLIRWRQKPFTSIIDDLSLYKSLAKARLSALVVLTAMAGYAMCPSDPTLTNGALEVLLNTFSTLPGGTSLESLLPDSPIGQENNSLTLSVLLPMTVGTSLCAASAASFNQLIEAPYDAQMTRTRGRPVPRKFISPLHSTSFGLLTGFTGVGTLLAINPLTASIGLGTIILYCPLYTISKRHTIYNTWLGALVGALPPLIGWSACTNSLDPFTQSGGWAMFSLLFFWQFPHFMSLAHTLRSSYAASGYRMLSVLDPKKNALVSLRYSIALIPLSFLFPPLV